MWLSCVLLYMLLYVICVAVWQWTSWRQRRCSASNTPSSPILSHLLPRYSERSRVADALMALCGVAGADSGGRCRSLSADHVNLTAMSDDVSPPKRPRVGSTSS